MPGKAIDLSGKEFGDLTAIKRDMKIRSHVAWFCTCKCGLKLTVSAKKLKESLNTCSHDLCRCGSIADPDLTIFGKPRCKECYLPDLSYEQGQIQTNFMSL